MNNGCVDWTPFVLTLCVFLFLAGWWSNNMWRFITSLFYFARHKLSEIKTSQPVEEL